MFPINRLTEIGLSCQTDKAFFHLFTEFYMSYFETFLKKDNVCILEIGIAKGASLRMLNAFFPNAKIYAIDISKESVRLELGKNVHTHLCCQIDFQKINELFGGMKFDIIIDDGSHLTSHQQKSLGFLFPFLKKGGVYVCEDLHTSYRHEFIDSDVTTLEMIEHYQKTKTMKCNLLSENEIDYLNKHVVDVVVYERSRNALQCYSCKKVNVEDKLFCDCGVRLSPLEKSITSVFLHSE